MTTGTGEALDDMFRTLDVEGLDRWLLAASPEEKSEARSWYEKSKLDRRRAFDTRYEVQMARPAGVAHLRNWMRATFGAGVAPPGLAAKWFGANGLALHAVGSDTSVAVQAFRRVVIARGASWCREFVPLAAQSQRCGDLHEILFPVIEAYGLPVPSGSGFADDWARSHGAWRTGDRDLAQRWRADPLMPDILYFAVAAGSAHEIAGLAPAVAELASEGLVDRERLVRECFELLTNAPTVTTQRTIVQLLAAFGSRSEDIPGGLPMLLGIFATRHGSVVTALMSQALDLVADGNDLVELSTVIAGRAEKKPKMIVIDAIRTSDLAARVGAESTRRALAVVREANSDDLQLVAKIDKLLPPGVEVWTDDDDIPTATGLWDLVPDGTPYVRTPIGGHEDGLTPEAAQTFRYMTWQFEEVLFSQPGSEALSDVCLAMVVREAHLHGRTRALAHLRRIRLYGFGVLGEALHEAAANPTLAGFRKTFEWRNREDPNPPGRPRSLVDAGRLPRYLMIWETVLRLGNSPCLLSTPTHDDGSIEFDTLADRVRASQGSSFGPLDLLFALLRLRPVDPSALDVLAGMALPVDRSVVLPEQPCNIEDGVDAIRTWVDAGGVRPLTIGFREGRWTTAASLPISPELFGAFPSCGPGLFGELGWPCLSASWTNVTEQKRLVPAWCEGVLIAGTGRARYDYLSEADPDLRDVEFPPARRSPPDEPWAMYEQGVLAVLRTDLVPGPITYDAILAPLASVDEYDKKRAVRVLRQVILDGRFDPDQLVTAAAQRLSYRFWTLTRPSRTFEALAYEGFLRPLWPALMGIAEAACSQSRAPAGLSDFLAMLNRLAPEVPAPALPPAVVAFAGGKGSTQAHLQARAFVQLVTRMAAR